MTTSTNSQPARLSPSSSSSASSANERRSPPSSGSTTRAAGASTSSSAPLRWDRETIQFSVNVWVLVVAVLAMLPLIPKSLSNRAYRLSFMGTACSSVYSLYYLYGKPRAWNMQEVKLWLQSIIATKDFIYTIYYLAFVTSNLHLTFALLPVVSRSLEHSAKFIRRNFSRSSLYRKYLEEACVWMESNSRTLRILCSQAEIGIGFLLIISLLSCRPQSNIIQTFMSSNRQVSNSSQLNQTHPFMFPETQSAVLPNPSPFFSPNLLLSPLPTNSFFQNFVLKNGDQPEYIHPYLIKSSPSSLSISYPSLYSNTAFTYQSFNADFTISAIDNPDPNQTHVISSFSDLSVTLDFPNLRFYLVRGSPFITSQVMQKQALSISTIHAILDCTPNSSKTKYKINLNNGQTWVLYSSSPIDLSYETSKITSLPFLGIIRIAIIPNSDVKLEPVLDKFSSCYPVSGSADLSKPLSVEYKWEKKGWGDLLMLASPLHLQLLDKSSSKVLDDFKYKSIDGELVGVVGDSWLLKTDPVSVTWHSIKGVKEESYPEVIDALIKDVDGLDSTSISTTSSYFYGKLVARAARLALIAEEIGYLDIMPKIQKYLKDAISPWLDGTFNGNGFLYDKSWGGVITKQGSQDSGADFGFGLYNDHHYHIGYFIYGIAVLAKVDPIWGSKYRPQAYSLMADFMTLDKSENTKYTRLRCFDLWKLHSWAGGLTEFGDGRNQESTSEAVNAYYSAALMGLAYGDKHLVSTSSLLLAMEIHASQTWWHVKQDVSHYSQDFISENRLVGVLWANKRDSALWFAPAKSKECRLGIQVLPLLPITEVLFSDVGFVKQLVEWALPALGREGVGEGWKGFVYALEGVYEKEIALEKIRSLKGHDDGNSLSNLLWWIYSRDESEQGYEGGGRQCWFGHYCH